MDDWYEKLNENVMVLGEGVEYDLDCYKTKLNNNVLVCGASGSGKTRSLVTPNLLLAEGSYIVSDPKGNLHNKWKDYLEKKGYTVLRLDFTSPEKSVKYNPLCYINGEYEIIKVANQIVSTSGGCVGHYDPFWDRMCEMLLGCMIAYLIERGDREKMHFDEVCRLLSLSGRENDRFENNRKSELLKLFALHEGHYGKTVACKLFDQVNIAPSKTYDTIIATVYSVVGKYRTAEVKAMMSGSDIDFKQIASQKTALFVVVNDYDRSMDGLANLFFSQALSELCKYADNECVDNRLPIPVRFVLDDFATNVKIQDFPKMISCIRSRGISAMLMIQAEGQLEQAYQADAQTIIANCDNFLFLGGNEMGSIEAIARRANVPIEQVQHMPIGYSWIFRRGEKPRYVKNIDYDRFVEVMMAKGNVEKNTNNEEEIQNER